MGIFSCVPFCIQVFCFEQVPSRHCSFPIKMCIIIALLCHVGPWLWVWTPFSLSFILSSCSGQVFPLNKTLGIWDSQTDAVSSKLPRETGNASSKTRSNLKDVSRGGLDYCSLFLSVLGNDSDHQAWSSGMISPCFDTLAAYAASFPWSWLPFKIKLWTVQPRVALFLS